MKVFPNTILCCKTVNRWRTNIYNVIEYNRKLEYQNDKSIKMENLIQKNNVGKKMNKMSLKWKGCMRLT